MGIGHHVHNRRMAALVDTAQGFFLQGSNTTRLVAGRGLGLSNVASGGNLLPFPSMNVINNLPAHSWVLGPFRQYIFRADHLNGLTEHSHAPQAHHAVADKAQHWVCHQTRGSVGAAAFHAQHQLREVAGLPVAPRRLQHQLLGQASHLGNGVGIAALLLNDNGLCGLVCLLPQQFQKRDHVIDLAAEPHQHHAVNIRVCRQSGQYLVGSPQIFSVFTAAVLPDEGNHAVHSLAGPLDYLRCATHRSHDEYLVANPHGAVLTAVT